MRLKSILVVMLLLGSCLFIAANSNAETMNLTLNYDWERDYTFSSTSIAINTADWTFTTGEGSSGTLTAISYGGTVSYAFIFNTGAQPVYTGPFYGFFSARLNISDVGFWYLSGPTGVESRQEGTRDSSGNL